MEPTRTDAQILAETQLRFGETHNITKVHGTSVVLSELPEGVSVCAGDGKTYHFQLEKK